MITDQHLDQALAERVYVFFLVDGKYHVWRESITNAALLNMTQHAGPMSRHRGISDQGRWTQMTLQ